MDQVSRPVLIALAAVVVFVAAHFTVLAPKNDSGSSPASATAPGQTGLQGAIDKANHAVGAHNGAVARHEQAAKSDSGGTAATAAPAKAKATATAKAKPPAAPAKAKASKPLPKLEPGDRSGPILRELAGGKVVVALFYTRAGADDHAALRAVRSAARHHGRVAVHVIPIKRVGAYNALTTGVQILQSPTVVVIGPDHKARTIVGYTEVKEIDQTVGDVGGKGFTARPAKHLTGWAAKASNICQDTTFGFETAGAPTDVPGLKHYLAHGAKLERRDRHRVAVVPATGAKQVAAKRALINAYDADLAAVASAQSKLKAGASPGPVMLTLVQAEVSYIKRNRPALHAVHERHCLG